MKEWTWYGLEEKVVVDAAVVIEFLKFRLVDSFLGIFKLSAKQLSLVSVAYRQNLDDMGSSDLWPHLIFVSHHLSE